MWNKLKASSKEAQRQLGGSMKGAGSMLEASCRNRNANSRKLAGSLHNPEGNIKQAWRKLQASLRQFCGKAQGLFKERPEGSWRWAWRKLKGMLEARSKEAWSKARWKPAGSLKEAWRSLQVSWKDAQRKFKRSLRRMSGKLERSNHTISPQISLSPTGWSYRYLSLAKS